MAFCPKCGKQNNEGSIFCESCGNRFPDYVINQYESSKAERNAFIGNINNTLDKSIDSYSNRISKTHKFTLTAIISASVFALIVLVSISIALLHSRKSVDLSDFIKIEYEGYDGFGTASVKIDYDSMADEIWAAMGNRKKDLKKSQENYYSSKNQDDIYDLYQYISGVEVELDKTSGLSNGDEITAEVTYTGMPDDVNMKEGKTSVSVEKLKEIKDFNPFDYITLNKTGIAPRGELSIEVDYSVEEMKYIDFVLDKDCYINNGDTITITANISDPAAFAKKFGETVSENTITGEINGLPEYVQNIDQIPETLIEKMCHSAEEDLYRSYSDHYTLESCEYVGMFFLKSKSSGSDAFNKAIVIERVNLSSESIWADEKQPDFYYYCEFSDLSCMSDGIVTVDLSNYESPKTRYENPANITDYKGAKDIMTIFDKYVASRANGFDYETTIEL